MKDNIGVYDRLLRAGIGVALLVYAWYANSLIALGFAIFTFYEAVSSWCAFYALIGKSTCPLSYEHQQNSQREKFMVNERQLALSGGIVWGGLMFVMTIISLYTGYGSQWLHLMMDIYPGYTISWMGSISGFLYGFLDGFIGLYILGWLYNKLG